MTRVIFFHLVFTTQDEKPERQRNFRKTIVFATFVSLEVSRSNSFGATRMTCFFSMRVDPKVYDLKPRKHEFFDSTLDDIKMDRVGYVRVFQSCL